MTKTNTQKPKCRGCGKSTGKVKYFIIADNLEEPKSYHQKCVDEMLMKVFIKLNEK